METKKFTILSLCMALIIIIGIGFGLTFYNNYIKPESYVNGDVNREPYESTKLLDYMSSDDILFSAELNKSVFSTVDNKSTCEYTFEHIDFNGEKNTYGLYVNDYLLNNLTTNAGTISGEYEYRYYDPTKNVVCDSTMTISFSFYTLKTVCHLELDSTELPYLMKFLSQNQFIVSIVKTDYKLVSDIPVDENFSIVTLIVDNRNTRNITKLIGSKLNIVDYLYDTDVIKSVAVEGGDAVVNDNVITFGKKNSIVVVSLVKSVSASIYFSGDTPDADRLVSFQRGVVYVDGFDGQLTETGLIEIYVSNYTIDLGHIDFGNGSYTTTWSAKHDAVLFEYTNADVIAVEIVVGNKIPGELVINPV